MIVYTHKGVARGNAVVQYHIGQVYEPLAAAMPTRRGFAVLFRNNRYDRQIAPFGFQCYLTYDFIDAAVGEYDETVRGLQDEIPQYRPAKALHAF